MSTRMYGTSRMYRVCINNETGLRPYRNFPIRVLMNESVCLSLCECVSVNLNLRTRPRLETLERRGETPVRGAAVRGARWAGRAGRPRTQPESTPTEGQNSASTGRTQTTHTHTHHTHTRTRTDTAHTSSTLGADRFNTMESLHHDLRSAGRPSTVVGPRSAQQAPWRADQRQRPGCEAAWGHAIC
jgi:hypothetical protein